MAEESRVPRWMVPTLCVVAPLTLGLAATGPGAQFAAGAQNFLMTYAGVVALVSFSITVMVGLTATDRSVLKIRYRVLAQAVHRTTSTTGMSFLVAHIAVKILAGHLSTPAAEVFGLSSVDLGVVAFLLFTIVTLSGVARFWFAAGTRPVLWRGLHALCYVAWPVSIVHGLTAGRQPATYVIVGYTLCLIFVGVMLLNRVVLVVQPVDPVREGEPVANPTPVRRRKQVAENEKANEKVNEKTAARR
jgi:DMSO/TMAO reductase YedYZ heme-binding membrane subunit